MIKVEKLTRYYGNFKALDDISFDVSDGKITGFLGPNGAGKTTTLQILTGFLAPNEGEISICGLDIEKYPQKIKQIVGYLPEYNPLYEDLSVFDYLYWSGRLKGLKSKKLLDAIKKCSSQCGLMEVISKPIAHLSKGYRQRTAIANAILHNPKVLFLDEPTSGLDPNQAHQMRNLIKDLSREKTIMLSTHILAEAKQICDEIIIINKAKIVERGSTSLLLSGKAQEQKIVLITEKSINPNDLKQKLSHFGLCHFQDLQNEYEFTLQSTKSIDLRRMLFDFIVQNKIPLLEFKKQTISLEELFRKLTL